MAGAIEAKDPEVMPGEETRELVGPVAGSLIDLAGQLSRGTDIIEAGAKILATARKAAIAITNPEDWLLFKDKQGREIGYLQDAGCDRLVPLLGIDIFDVSRPERVQLNSTDFMYLISGSGRCRFTQQTIENVEGGRASTDDFILKQNPPPKGAQLELLVRKAARANLDGQIVRTLAGMQSVPLEEIMEAYKGDASKTRGRFREGRGYGSQVDRGHVSGATGQQAQGGDGDYINEAQRKKLFAVWKQAGWQDAEVKNMLQKKFGIESAFRVPKDKFNEVLAAIEGGIAAADPSTDEAKKGS